MVWDQVWEETNYNNKNQPGNRLTLEELLDFRHLLRLGGQEDTVDGRQEGGNPKYRLELLILRLEEVLELALHPLLKIGGEGMSRIALVLNHN